MINRREFSLLSAAALSAPVILQSHVFAAEKRERRSVSQMNSADPFFTDYAQAVEAMHALPATDNRNWSNQAKVHLNHCPHGRLGFASWHRIYLDRFEAICAELIGKPDFALAYWDWTANDGKLPNPFFDQDSLTVTKWNDDGLDSGTNASRGLQKGDGLLSDPRFGGAFFQRNIDSILRETSFNRLWRRLESSPHNNAHIILGSTGGHMGGFQSPLDPIFWLHHCNVDRLWAEWQAANNTTPTLDLNFTQIFSNEDGQLGDFSADDYVNLTDLNFTYDTISNPATGSEVIAQTTDFKNLASAVGDNGERIIGSSSNIEISSANIETRLTVPTAGLLREMFSSRVFRPISAFDKPRAAVEPRRILARLKDVKRGSKSNVLLANVFVNCPYLSPETPVQDQHFASSFSFFGSMENCLPDCEFVIDITEPLRQQFENGRTKADSVDVQILPIDLSTGTESSKTEFTIGSVELISV